MLFFSLLCLLLKTIFTIFFSAPDMPDFNNQHSMSDGTDYAQQTDAVNVIESMVISQERRIICYNQIIYDDDIIEADEYLGLSLGIRENSLTTVLTQVKHMYDQAAIVILDNDRRK